MNKKSMIIAVAIASMMFLLGGCSMSGQSKSGERQQVEGLKELGTIQVISRAAVRQQLWRLDLSAQGL